MTLWPAEKQELNMFRMWIREWKDNHVLRDVTIGDPTEDTRTHKVLSAIRKAALELDLPEPIWLDRNIREFQKHSRTRFDKDCFIEEIPFDHLEVRIIEED